MPSSISFQKSKYQIKECKIFDIWCKFHWIFENLMKNKPWYCDDSWLLEIKDVRWHQVLRWGGIGNGWVWRRFKNEQSVIKSWSRCDIDTCYFSLRLFTYSRTAPCKCRYSSFNEDVYDECYEKNLIRTHVNIMKVVDMFDLLSKWDEMRSFW